MKKAIIVTNGIFPLKFLPLIKKEKYIVGVDKAGFSLLKHGLVPDLVIGDMDSVSKGELREIKKLVKEITIFNKEKDSTDTELAVREIIKKGYKKCVMYGANGTRVDHFLSSLLLLEKYHKQLELVIIDNKSKIEFIDHHKKIFIDSNYRYISFISLTEKTTLSLVNFKYPLTNKTISRGDTLCVSNELIKKSGEILVHAGKVLMIRSSD